MNELFRKMTYVEFKDWCNERACDGQWGCNCRNDLYFNNRKN